MSEPVTKIAHFVIEGRWFTNFARDLFREGDPARAWRLVTGSLKGRSDVDRVARELLDGRLALTRDSSMGLRTCRDKAASNPNGPYQKAIRYAYAGRIKIDGVWRRPSAIVVGLNARDARIAWSRFEIADESGAFVRISERWIRARYEAYANPDETVVWTPCPGGRLRRYNGEGRHGDNPGYETGEYLLWRACLEGPHWWQPERSITTALAAWQAAGHQLDERNGEFADELLDRDEERKQLERDADEAIETARAYTLLETGKDDDTISPEEEARWNLRLADHLADCARWRQEILRRNGDDWIELRDRQGELIARVPGKPFRAYAMDRTQFAEFAPWEPVCPSGLKLPLDSRAHSDWVVGAGLPVLGYDYRGELHEAASAMAGRLQRTRLGFMVHVLLDAGPVEGVVGQEVLVVPDLHPDRLEAMLGARAVITEQGGEAAHLVQVAREQRPCTIVRDDGATRYYRPGMRVRITPSRGSIEIVNN
jgi:phosphohistidine swiveling domain-containing protein